MTAFGPYETEQAAAAEPLAQAVRLLPHDPAAPGRASRELQLSFLREACIDAGVQLGGYDRRILAWLSTWAPPTVQVVIGLISRAYAAGIKAAGIKPVDRVTGSFLLWSNKHHAWWRANERGYTDSIEEAGRYPYERASSIVLRSSCDGRLLSDRTDPVTGREYRQAPTVLVLAPECVDLKGGADRG